MTNGKVQEHQIRFFLLSRIVFQFVACF